MTRLRTTLLIVAAFAAGLAGVMMGQHIGGHPAEDGGKALHRLLHSDLDLDARQSAALGVLEDRYAARRRVLEIQMRADNARLAEAIEAEHGISPRVDAAIEASHRTMGTLQKETVAHVFAMRRLLRPEQAVRFDRAVARALVDDGR